MRLRWPSAWWCYVRGRSRANNARVQLGYKITLCLLASPTHLVRVQPRRLHHSRPSHHLTTAMDRYLQQQKGDVSSEEPHPGATPATPRRRVSSDFSKSLKRPVSGSGALQQLSKGHSPSTAPVATELNEEQREQLLRSFDLVFLPHSTVGVFLADPV